MSSVWSRHQAVQRTFGTTVSVADSAYQRLNLTDRRQLPVQIFLVHVFRVLQTCDVTRFFTNRYSRQNILPQQSRGSQGAISCRSLGETNPGWNILTISVSSRHSWMCVHARVLTPHC